MGYQAQQHQAAKRAQKFSLRTATEPAAAVMADDRLLRPPGVPAGPSALQLRVAVPQLPDGISLNQPGLAAHLRANLQTSLSSLPGRPGGLTPTTNGDISPSPRTDAVAAMDMLNDMFQRQARRLESQLYARAQDAHAIEAAQKQARETQEQVRSLERYHVDQAARIRQGSKAIEELQTQMRATSREHDLVLSTCDALQMDVETLRESLRRADPQAAEAVQLVSETAPSLSELRARASDLEKSVTAAEQTASLHVAATPPTSIAMCSSACNPLHDLSAVANYAHRSGASPRAAGETPRAASTGAQRSDDTGEPPRNRPRFG